MRGGTLEKKEHHNPTSVPTHRHEDISPDFRWCTWSMLSNLFFIHLIAWYLPSLTFCALRTSENVPSPFFATRRYFLIFPLKIWFFYTSIYFVDVSNGQKRFVLPTISTYVHQTMKMETLFCQCSSRYENETVPRSVRRGGAGTCPHFFVRRFLRACSFFFYRDNL